MVLGELKISKSTQIRKSELFQLSVYMPFICPRVGSHSSFPKVLSLSFTFCKDNWVIWFL
jgi:hypothetical protein